MRSPACRLRRGAGSAAAWLLAALAACRGAPAPPPAAARDLAQRMEAGVVERPGLAYPLPYRLFVPAGLQPGRHYPLIVYLHGAGGRGTDGLGHLSPDVGVLLSERVQSLGPAFVLAPQCPPGDEWVNRHQRPPFRSYQQARTPESDASRLTVALVERLRARHPIDGGRIYLTGPSMGGSGTWDLVTRHPGLFAAAVPITGVNDPSRAPAIAGLPVWAFHGTRDEISSVENTRAMVTALQAVGSPVRYTELEGVGHDSWTAAYASPALFPWLFAQRRPASP